MSRITARRARTYAPTRVLTLAGVVAVVMLAGACASSPSATDPTANTSSGVVINLGEQQQALETLLLSSGVLAGASYKVNFVDFQSGPLVDSGFAAHRIDVGTMGDLPASLAVSSGLPVVAIAADHAIGASEFLLAEPGITSIAQLRGKPVAYTTGTSEQAFALRALKSAGMTQKDVHQVNVSLEQLGTALQSGAAVASVVSVEQKADYMVDHPGAKVLANILTVSPPSYGYLLATKVALAEPAKRTAIEDLTKRIIKAENWEKTHKSDYVNDYYVKIEHQTPEVAKTIISAGGTATYVPITPAVQSALQGMVNIMAASGGIAAAFSVAPLFDQAEAARYNAVVAEVPQNG